MNIVVDLGAGSIRDGTEVVFRSPVDCSQVTGLKVYHDDGVENVFMFSDAHGNNVGDIDHLFAENVAVKVILDVTTGRAFVQNADTNAYLEGRFAELADSIVNEASGSVITIKDSSNRELQGLTISNTDAESVTVKVMGKNLADYRKARIRNVAGQTLTIDESIDGLYWAGNYYLIIPVSLPAGTTVSFSCIIESLDADYPSGLRYIAAKYADGELKVPDNAKRFTLEKDLESIYVYKENPEAIYSAMVQNIQLEIGKSVTEYEPYKGEQTLVVSVPDGLGADGFACEDFAQLHTYKPNTTIINDVGAIMEVEYVADTKNFILNEIKKEFTELQNAILASGANV